MGRSYARRRGMTERYLRQARRVRVFLRRLRAEPQPVQPRRVVTLRADWHRL